MKQNTQMWGWILVGLGALFLLENIGINIVGWIWGLVFAAAGAAFLWVYQQNRSQWWPLIPGFTLLGLGILILFEPIFGGSWGGAVFLSAIGLGFLAVYLNKRENWWALIPGGTLLTLGVVAGNGERGDAGGFLFFLGLALTFAVVFLVGQRWAVFPAIACAVLMLITSTALKGFMAFLIPLILVAAGVYFLMRKDQPKTGQGGSV